LTTTRLPGERSRNILEHHTRSVLVVQDDLGGGADVVLPGEPADLADLAEFARLLDPLAQVGIGDLRPQAGCSRRAARPPGFGCADGIPHRGGIHVVL
jgi:hypothetical protein